MRYHRLPTLLAVALLASACSAAGPSPSRPAPVPTNSSGIVLARADVPRASVSPDVAADAANGIDAFGFALYRRLMSHDGNLVFSPTSIELALAMARPGAKGATGTQMDSVMHGVGADALASAINALAAALEARNGTFKAADGSFQPVALHVANSAFGQKDLTFESAYLNALASRFGAGVRLVDYKTDYEAARALINQWVSDQTEQRIPKLLQQGTLSEMTRLVLVNAIYMKAPWLTPFVKDMTGSGAFTRADGSVVQVPLMSGREISLPYAKGAGWQAVELPYLGGALAMDVIVPTDLAAFEATLDGGTFASAVAALTPHIVQLKLPKWDIQTSTDLGGELMGMGMPLAFDPNKADFSGMTAQEKVFISAVIHQANITVDESGTEAAAATAVIMDTTSAPADVINLIVDHPFLFAVRDVATAAVLFLGRVVDPSAKR